MASLTVQIHVEFLNISVYRRAWWCSSLTVEN